MSRPRKGFRNRYRSNMPWTEVFAKDLQCLISDAWSWICNGFYLPVLVVYPDFPSKKTTIHKIGRKLKYRITNKRLKRAELVLWFHDTTHASSEVLVQYYPTHSVINRQCMDISKKYVDSIHATVFGYSTIIDPKTHVGPAVAKSDINALHDGEIVRCPLSKTSEKAVYQIVIDNETETGEFLDYRVPVIGGDIPLVYAKYKKKEVRFTNDVHRSTMHSPEDIFSKEEFSCIVQLATKMGAEFCEFDVLRDKFSGRIYVIDVNKTPYGPPKGLTSAEHNGAIDLLTQAFQRAFIPSR